MKIIFFGLKNCDTCQKARRWLDGQSIQYEYKDVRADAIAVADLRQLIGAYGDWQPFLNRRSTTWRRLDNCLTESLDESKAITLIIANPTLMKRPVISVEKNGKIAVTVGFGTAEQKGILDAVGLQ